LSIKKIFLKQLENIFSALFLSVFSLFALP